MIVSTPASIGVSGSVSSSRVSSNAPVADADSSSVAAPRRPTSERDDASSSFSSSSASNCDPAQVSARLPLAITPDSPIGTSSRGT